METTTRIPTKPLKTKEACNIYRSQSQSAKHDRGFYCTIIFIYTLVEIACTIADLWVNLYFLSTTKKVLRTVFTVIFYVIFNIAVFIYFTFRKKGYRKRAQFLETIVVLVLGIWVLSRYILCISDAYDLPDGLQASKEILLRFYAVTSDTLLWFILIFSFVQHIYNLIIYIILMLLGHILMLFYGHQRVIGSKVILEGILVIIVFVYMQRKKMKLLHEAWKLSVSDVFYKNVLNLLPEGVMVLSPNQKRTYTNHYLEHNLAWNPQGDLAAFSSSFQSLKLRYCFKETRFQQYVFPSACAKKINLEKSKSTFSTLSSIDDKEGLLKSNACKISTFMELVEFFQHNTETWASISTHTLVFDSKYIHPESKETIAIEIKAFILHGEKDIQLTLLFRDTTDRDKIAMLEAETESYKNNLIASFSHELRTPLNSNLGSLEQTMKHPQVPQEVKETLLEPALVSAKLLLHLVNDTLDYSQTLKGDLQVHIKPLNIAHTIKECLFLFEKRISAKGLEFELFIEKSSIVLWTDHQRLCQILTNLLSNALKFTFEGMIQVRFSKATDGCYKLSVMDTGTGMDQESQESIPSHIAVKGLRKNLVIDSVFESKVSADSAGIGLGLLMASTLCYMLSPEEKPGLNFVSEKDEGSEFYVFLKDFCPGIETEMTENLESRRESQKIFHTNSPMLSDVSEDDMMAQKAEEVLSHKTLTFKNKLVEVKEEEKAKESPLVQRKIQNPVMVVDDEIFNVLILENYCKSSGLKTEKAFNGKDAIEKIKKIYAQGQKVDVVLMDVNMPIMCGYEATRILREMIRNKEIEDLVIIGITAYVAKEKIDKCYESGMTEVLNKPISHDDFTKIMKKYGFH